MIPQSIIRKKRDGREITRDEIHSFINGTVDGSVSDGQIGAFTMAVYLNGMSTFELVEMTLAMRDSGRVLDWGPSGLDDRRLVDKHSSGGVGDEKITLLVTPLAAACGVFVPNISGRGLDYCAGEIDMLDAIPGYQTSPDADRFRAVVRDVGAAISGPTSDLAPADRKLYNMRDVTATVESVALISSSIMSKKLAVSPRGLVICVGRGSGAYMATLKQARELADAMSMTAAGAGVPSVMLLTDLDSVLGSSVGNAVGVVETVDFLTGRYQDSRVLELVLAVVAEMALLAGVVDDLGSGRALAAARLDDGSAADRFGRMIEALGGPQDFIKHPDKYLPAAAVVRPVFPERSGYVVRMNAGSIGHGLVELGGGRTKPDDAIDLAVGFSDLSGINDKVGSSRPLAVLHASDEASWNRTADRLRSAIEIGDAPVAPAGPIVLERLARIDV
jgi:thymidine phosphorylase